MCVFLVQSKIRVEYRILIDPDKGPPQEIMSKHHLQHFLITRQRQVCCFTFPTNFLNWQIIFESERDYLVDSGES